MRTRGFSPKWIVWVLSLVKGGSVCVRLNDENNSFSTPGKGIRQGGPLSLLLLNIVVDVFTKILIKAARANLIRGLLPDVYERGIISLQYADDTLLFLENNLHHARTLSSYLLVLRISQE